MSTRQISMLILLAAGCLVSGFAVSSAQQRHGLTDLMSAAKSGNADSVKVLLEAGAQVDARDDFGMTALMWSVAAGRADIAAMLLEAGARVDEQNNSGYTALIHAADLNRPEVLKTLLEAGANPLIKNSLGFTALRYAVSRGNTGIVESLVGAGIDLKAGEYSGILVQPAYKGYSEVVRLLLAAGADVNARDTADEYQATALMRASMAGHTALVKSLLEAGAEVNAEDIDGDRALKYARLGGHPEIAELLVMAGAVE